MTLLGRPATGCRRCDASDLPDPQIHRNSIKVQHSHHTSRTGAQHRVILQALYATGIFSKTQPDVVSAFARQLAPVHFPPGDIVTTNGDFGDRLCVIISGKVKVSYRRPDGHEMLITVVGPAELLGVTAMFDPAACYAGVTALTAVLAVPIERAQLLRWMAQHSEIGEQLLRLLARWAKLMTTFVGDFASAGAPKRIANRLLFLEWRFGRQDGDTVRVVHDLTSEDFSRLVGVPPKTVSATLSQFERNGWISLEDNAFRIADSQALRSIPSLHAEGDGHFGHRHSA